MTSLPRVLLVGDQRAGSSPAVPNRPGCIICQSQTGPDSDWCPTHLSELRGQSVDTGPEV